MVPGDRSAACRGHGRVAPTSRSSRPLPADSAPKSITDSGAISLRRTLPKLLDSLAPARPARNIDERPGVRSTIVCQPAPGREVARRHRRSTFVDAILDRSSTTRIASDRKATPCEAGAARLPAVTTRSREPSPRRLALLGDRIASESLIRFVSDRVNDLTATRSSVGSRRLATTGLPGSIGTRQSPHVRRPCRTLPRQRHPGVLLTDRIRETGDNMECGSARAPSSHTPALSRRSRGAASTAVRYNSSAPTPWVGDAVEPFRFAPSNGRPADRQHSTAKRRWISQRRIALRSAETLSSRPPPRHLVIPDKRFRRAGPGIDSVRRSTRFGYIWVPCSKPKRYRCFWERGRPYIAAGNSSVRFRHKSSKTC